MLLHVFRDLNLSPVEPKRYEKMNKEFLCGMYLAGVVTLSQIFGSNPAYLESVITIGDNWLNEIFTLNIIVKYSCFPITLTLRHEKRSAEWVTHHFDKPFSDCSRRMVTARRPAADGDHVTLWEDNCCLDYLQIETLSHFFRRTLCAGRFHSHKEIIGWNVCGNWC